MSKESTTQYSDGKALAGRKPPRSLAIARNGIRTGNDFANLMSALMSDLIEGRVAPGVGNATVNAGGKLLKVVELQYKHGVKAPEALPASIPALTLVHE